MVSAQGTLLNGRLTYRQPESGFRSGIEPVLLAAATPAVAGDVVLEAGTGAGAALLCLHARVAGIRSIGVEVDDALVRLAAANAAANRFADMAVLHGRIEAVALPANLDHAIANPPYHPPDGTASPVSTRNIAKRGSACLIEAWVTRLATQLRDRGSLTLIVTAAMVPLCLNAMATARCSCSVIFPLWPMPGRSAKLVMLRGIRNSRMPMRVAAGLVLHDPDGGFTASAQAILREGAALPLDH